MELEETILITSTGLLTIGGVGLLYATHKLYQTINELRNNMTTFLDHYMAYATPKIRTPDDVQAIIDLGKTRAETEL